jgi:hypothetical protein
VTIDTGVTLTVGDGQGHDGSLSGPVVDNGTLAFVTQNNETCSANISGPGKVSLCGTINYRN